MIGHAYRGAGSAFEDTALALEKTTINAWMAAAKVAHGETPDAEAEAAVERMVRLLRQDVASISFARTHGAAGAPPPRQVPRRESLLAMARRAAEHGDDPYGLRSAPEDGATKLAEDLLRLLDGDRAVSARLDPFLERVHRVAATAVAEPGEKLTRL